MNRIFRLVIIWVFLLGTVAVCVWLVISRRQARAERHAEKPDSRPVVRPVFAEKGSDTLSIVLPGSLQPYLQTAINGRVNGYIKKWYVDIGDPVTEGQLMAEIETPELDRQIDQARASESLSKANLDRVNSVTMPGAVSEQDRDTRKAAYEGAVATRRQLEAQAKFKRITAPFNGVVTARNVDFGSLVNAGTSSGAELFRVEQVSRLRIFTEVPQAWAFYMQPGLDAQMTFREFPGKTFTARLVRTSGALSEQARTLTAVFETENTDHKLLAGMYTELNMTIIRKNAPVILNATALLLNNDKPYVVEIDSSNHIHIKPILLGLDNGITVEVVSGAIPGRRLVNFPTNELKEGEEVRLAKPEEKKETGKEGRNNTAVGKGKQSPGKEAKND
ncbi:MAG: efflux RND transporter periplasmic adaptor subunit [Bacteroidota bacterium]